MQRRNFLAQASTLALSSGWLSACGGGGSTDTDTENNGTSSGTPTTSTNPVIRTPPGTAAKSRVIVVGGGSTVRFLMRLLSVWLVLSSGWPYQAFSAAGCGDMFTSKE